MKYQRIVECDGYVDYIANALQPQFSQLSCAIDWQQEQLVMFGKKVTVPRLVAFYGDAGINYRYSATNHQAMPWIKELITIKKQVEQCSQHEFNCVLANYYRNGEDYMGWHSDDEKTLGKNPVIASVSFGASRDFKLKHQSGEQHSIVLEDGSLLIMGGALQHFWQHCLPKRKKVTEPRINLTFRQVRG